jgi:hypothetical protein
MHKTKSSHIFIAFDNLDEIKTACAYNDLSEMVSGVIVAMRDSRALKEVILKAAFLFRLSSDVVDCQESDN